MRSEAAGRVDFSSRTTGWGFPIYLSLATFIPFCCISFIRFQFHGSRALPTLPPCWILDSRPCLSRHSPARGGSCPQKSISLRRIGKSTKPFNTNVGAQFSTFETSWAVANEGLPLCLINCSECPFTCTIPVSHICFVFISSYCGDMPILHYNCTRCRNRLPPIERLSRGSTTVTTFPRRAKKGVRTSPAKAVE